MVKKIFEEDKKWYQSKTMIANILLIVAGILTAISDQLAAGGVLTGIALLNIVLRVITKSKLQW